jgi:hypothetical protein
MMAGMAVTVFASLPSDDNGNDRGGEGILGAPFTADDLKFTELTAPAGGNPGTVSLTDGTGWDFAGTSGIVHLPSSVWDGSNEYVITEIGYEAFIYTNVVTFTGDLSSLKTIGDKAFAYCHDLTLANADLSSLQTIGEYAFYPCDILTLANADLSSLQTIEKAAFSNCGNLPLANADLSSLQTIGDNAFTNCNLLKLDGVNLSSLQTICEYSFYE